MERKRKRRVSEIERGREVDKRSDSDMRKIEI